MTPTQPSAFVPDGDAMFVVITITALFSLATVFLMVNDYRLYLDDHWQRKYRFADFVRREQFYLYLLLLFVLLILGELWLQSMG